MSVRTKNGNRRFLLLLPSHVTWARWSWTGDRGSRCPGSGTAAPALASTPPPVLLQRGWLSRESRAMKTNRSPSDRPQPKAQTEPAPHLETFRRCDESLGSPALPHSFKTIWDCQICTHPRPRMTSQDKHSMTYPADSPAVAAECCRTTRASSGTLKTSTAAFVKRCWHVARERLDAPSYFQHPACFLKKVVFTLALSICFNLLSSASDRSPMVSKILATFSILIGKKVLNPLRVPSLHLEGAKHKLTTK